MVAEVTQLDRVVIRFAGDSGDGMQLTGDRFTSEAAAFGRMVRLRDGKVDGIAVGDLEVDDPSGAARVLVLGRGSSYGPIGAGCRRVRDEGFPIAQAHLRYLNPFPGNLGEILRRYDKVVIPELNSGQLARLIRAKFLVDAVSYTKVAGLPFKAAELQNVFLAHLWETTPGTSTPAEAR